MVAYAVCTAGGVWGQCQCQAPQAFGNATAQPATPRCGNGVREGTEQCDGNDLAGASCMSLSYGPGTLHCDAATCTYDTSMCASVSTGGTGGGGSGG